MKKVLYYFFTLVVLLISSCLKEKGPVPSVQCSGLNVSYSATIKTIIDTKCAISGCHVAGGNGNGDFTTYAGVKAKIGTNNDPFNNRLFVLGDMPQAGSPTLTDDEKQKIKCWLEAGALNN